ncbi:MAG: hypothetical protein AB7S70_16740 [Hyphomicrobium sp.]|uniref:hypothetical protein n=1 Tax=Hyphomicrobium sp. TaxID=82 RepID=UPI003D0DE0D3
MTNREAEPPSSEVTHLWASIFSSRPIEDGPFRNANWEVFLVPHQLLMQEDHFRHLQASADLVGDKDLIVLSDDLQQSVVINWDYQSLIGLAGHAVAVNDAYVFGGSAVWGMVCTHDDFSLLAGTPAFMDKYAREAGGREHLREAFLNWIRPPGWLVPTHITRKLLALAGWGD